MSSSVPSPPPLVGWSLPWLLDTGTKDNIEAGSRIAVVPLAPFAMVPVPLSLMIRALGPSRDQETDDGTDEPKIFRANRLMRGPAVVDIFASPHGAGGEAAVPFSNSAD